MAGGQGNPPSCLADAVECLHAGSLVIDDIQDDSRTRRGRPTLHREIGVPLAINAGNWMYFDALSRLSDNSLPSKLQNGLTKAMIQTGLRCHEGQSLDLSADVSDLDPSQWFELCRRTSRLKTGSLVSLAVTMGALAASAERPVRRALSRFGMNIGIALQMRNDLNEVRRLASSTPDQILHHDSIRSDDFTHRRVIWPWVWAAKKDQEQARQLVSALKAGQSCFAAIATELDQMVGIEGDRLIAARVHRNLRLLSEHVDNPDAISQLRSGLACIVEDNSSTEFK
jgi:geranylgeranyl pyrophosphate synthase